MAETVVDRLEMVDVEKHDPEAVGLAGRIGQQRLRQIVERPPIVEAGQRVGFGKPTQLLDDIAALQFQKMLGILLAAQIFETGEHVAEFKTEMTRRRRVRKMA